METSPFNCMIINLSRRCCDCVAAPWHVWRNITLKFKLSQKYYVNNSKTGQDSRINQIKRGTAFIGDYDLVTSLNTNNSQMKTRNSNMKHPESLHDRNNEQKEVENLESETTIDAKIYGRNSCFGNVPTKWTKRKKKYCNHEFATDNKLKLKKVEKERRRTSSKRCRTTAVERRDWANVRSPSNIHNGQANGICLEPPHFKTITMLINIGIDMTQLALQIGKLLTRCDRMVFVFDRQFFRILTESYEQSRTS